MHYRSRDLPSFTWMCVRLCLLLRPMSWSEAPTGDSRWKFPYRTSHSGARVGHTSVLFPGLLNHIATANTRLKGKIYILFVSQKSKRRTVYPFFAATPCSSAQFFFLHERRKGWRVHTQCACATIQLQLAKGAHSAVFTRTPCRTFRNPDTLLIFPVFLTFSSNL